MILLLQTRKHSFKERPKRQPERQESTRGVPRIRAIGPILARLQIHAGVQGNRLQLQASGGTSSMHRPLHTLNKRPGKWLKDLGPTDSGRHHMSQHQLSTWQHCHPTPLKSCIYFPLSVLAACFTGTYYIATNVFETGRKQTHTKEIHYPRDMSQLMVINQTFFPSCRKPAT